MGDLLHPYTDLDTLGRYTKILPYITNFLKNKELATKTVGPNFVVLKRGTKMTPLFVQDLQIVDENLLQRRANTHLDDIKKQLNPKQILIRQYFVPRKLINFFYACNNEYGNTIDRIFIDIDRQKLSAEDARKVALELLKVIKSDKKFLDLIDLKNLKTLWTGSSFHVIIMLNKTIDHKFYEKNLSFGKGKNSVVSRRADQITQTIGIPVFAGHERQKNAIILDCSNTPPGKLARCPFSLHIKDAKTIDGYCVPISEDELADKNLVSKLQKLTPESILKNINWYGKLLS